VSPELVEGGLAVGSVAIERTVAGIAHAAVRAADLLWPVRCAGCDLPGVALCGRCREALPRIDPATACPRCGAPDGSEGCAECGRVTHIFALARCAGVLEGPLARAITLHKDAGELRFTPLLAGLAAEAADEWCTWAQVVVGVPASPGARARRGFDHGALLAATFAALTGVPALEALRGLPRRDQRRLSRTDRAGNAASSIAVLEGVRVPARVLLLDDVMTTGATLDAAAGALVRAGAGEVRAVAVARACGGRL
jgi:predicted amidophosphoribosyltransferase